MGFIGSNATNNCNRSRAYLSRRGLGHRWIIWVPYGIIFEEADRITFSFQNDPLGNSTTAVSILT